MANSSPNAPAIAGLAQDTFYVGTLKGVGRIYQQTFVDTYAKVGFAKLYDRKTPLTAADLLNDRVIPFYEEHGIALQRVLTDRGTEYCGTHDRHEYELYLAVEDIDHTRTKAKSPQTTDVIDKQFLCSAEASRFSVPAVCNDGVARRGGQDWPEATARGGMVLTITSTAPCLATAGPRFLLIC